MLLMFMEMYNFIKLICDTWHRPAASDKHVQQLQESRETFDDIISVENYTILVIVLKKMRPTIMTHNILCDMTVHFQFTKRYCL